ncbi:MAG: hypothetical protein KBC78_01585 [Candidatus Pacebacteria bacterium]|nr:hypothetical protein [Candidatus Paceibacterota bacterium]
MKEKLKSWLLNDQIFYGSMVILVGITSFALGQASVEKEGIAKPIIQMIEPITLPASAVTSQSVSKNPTLPTNTSNPTTHGQFVASKNGSRYYLSNCSGAKRIKPENIISFPSREAAEAAGYSKAVNCPGL